MRSPTVAGVAAGAAARGRLVRNSAPASPGAPAVSPRPDRGARAHTAAATIRTRRDAANTGREGERSVDMAVPRSGVRHANRAATGREKGRSGAKARPVCPVGLNLCAARAGGKLEKGDSRKPENRTLRGENVRCAL